MFCPNCGKEIENNSAFCTFCGSSIGSNDDSPSNAAPISRGAGQQSQTIGQGIGSAVDNVISAGNELVSNTQANMQKNEAPRFVQQDQYANIYVDNDETCISSIGNGWISNFIFTGNIAKTAMILTNKRLYMQGKFFRANGAKLVSNQESVTVNTEDINATGFIRHDSVWMKISGIILIVIGLLIWMYSPNIDYRSGRDGYTLLATIMLFVGCILVILYFITKKTLFYIEYAGGTMQLKIVAGNYSMFDEFSKQIHRAKDSRRRELK